METQKRSWPPGSEDGLAVWSIVVTLAATFFVAAVGCAVTETLSGGIAAVVLLIVAVFFAAWAVFWSTINTNYPRFRRWVSGVAPKIAASAPPLLFILTVVIAINAATRIKALWPAIPKPVIQMKTVPKIISDPAQAAKIKSLEAELKARPTIVIEKPRICAPTHSPPAAICPQLPARQAGTVCPVLDFSALHVNDYCDLHTALDPAVDRLKKQLGSGPINFLANGAIG